MNDDGAIPFSDTYLNSVNLLYQIAFLVQNDVLFVSDYSGIYCRCDKMSLGIIDLSLRYHKLTNKLVKRWSWLRDRIFFSDPWVAIAKLSCLNYGQSSVPSNDSKQPDCLCLILCFLCFFIMRGGF